MNKGGPIVTAGALRLTVNGPHSVVGECNGVKPREVRKEQRRRITCGGKRESELPPPELPCWAGSVRALVKGRGVEASELASCQQAGKLNDEG